jgi:hypothetical protein
MSHLPRQHSHIVFMYDIASPGGAPCPTQDHIPCRTSTTSLECIPALLACNGRLDCQDGTDEFFCGCKYMLTIELPLLPRPAVPEVLSAPPFELLITMLLDSSQAK